MTRRNPLARFSVRLPRNKRRRRGQKPTPNAANAARKEHP